MATNSIVNGYQQHQWQGHIGVTCRLWYLERDGSKAASTVVSIDSSIQPPSYAVQIDKSNSIRYPWSPSTW